MTTLDYYTPQKKRKTRRPYRAMSMVWQKLARAVNGQYIKGGWFESSAVLVRHHPWTICLDTEPGGDGPTVIRFRAAFVNQDDFWFKACPCHVIAAIGEYFGFADIPIGHADFDRSFVTKSNNPVRLRALFSEPDIRTLMYAARPDIRICGKQYLLGPKLPPKVRILKLSVVESACDLDRLKDLHDLSTRTLETLCKIGVARRVDPELSLIKV